MDNTFDKKRGSVWKSRPRPPNKEIDFTSQPGSARIENRPERPEKLISTSYRRPTEPNPVHVYEVTGTYTAELTAKNGKDADVKTAEVTIRPLATEERLQLVKVKDHGHFRCKRWSGANG